MSRKIFYKKLGMTIREFRKEKDYTIEKLAELACINECFLGEIERGRKKPSLDTIYELSKVLDKNIYIFFKN